MRGTPKPGSYAAGPGCGCGSRGNRTRHRAPSRQPAALLRVSAGIKARTLSTAAASTAEPALRCPALLSPCPGLSARATGHVVNHRHFLLLPVDWPPHPTPRTSARARRTRLTTATASRASSLLGRPPVRTATGSSFQAWRRRRRQRAGRAVVVVAVEGGSKGGSRACCVHYYSAAMEGQVPAMPPPSGPGPGWTGHSAATG